jgi:hypothetical protein
VIKTKRKPKTHKNIKSYEEWLATTNPSILAGARRAFGDDLRPFYEDFRKNFLKEQRKKK